MDHVNSNVEVWLLQKHYDVVEVWLLQQHWLHATACYTIVDGMVREQCSCVCVYVCNNIAAAMGVDATAMYIAEAMLVVGWVDGIDVTVYLFLENERRVDEEGR